MVASVSELGVVAAQGGVARAAQLGDRLRRLGRRRAADIRSVVLQCAGLASVDYAMFQWHQIAGFVAVGISFFALDYITRGEDGNGGEVAR